jgi:hypothetical protein
MKLIEIKNIIFDALAVDNTRSLKKKYPNFVKGLDLRTKSAWLKIESLVTQEADALFQKALAEAKTENTKSNELIQQSLNDWENDKNRLVAESQAEEDGKLSHLSDYRMPEQFSKKAKKIKKSNKKSKNSNLVNFQK